MTDMPKSQKAGGRNPSGGGHAQATAPNTKTHLRITEDLMKRYHNALKKLAE